MELHWICFRKLNRPTDLISSRLLILAYAGQSVGGLQVPLLGSFGILQGVVTSQTGAASSQAVCGSCVESVTTVAKVTKNETAVHISVVSTRDGDLDRVTAFEGTN